MADVGDRVVGALLGRFGISLSAVAADETIPGSYWGDSEAGAIGLEIFVRPDTPLHSVLHETCHVICMDPDRRASLDGDAGGDDLEEAAVCYLQTLLADEIEGVGRDRLMRDMDAWGYSFRLGSTRAWFEQDAADARTWLVENGLISAQDRVRFRLR